jgi:methionine-gamma-lyase
MHMHKKTPSGHELNPETLALSLGYDPKLSEGSIKPPIFLTSTFQFNSAEDGKRFFEVAYGIREQEPNEKLGLIYSRINNPNLQIFEERIAAWDETESAAVFASGMAAITTAFFAMLRPGDVVLSTSPVYGGTHYFFQKILPQFGIEVHMVPAGNDAVAALAAEAKKAGEKKVRAIYIETPANPSNILTDIQGVSKLAEKLSKTHKRKVITMVDNTFLGPLFQRPATLGADLMLYSATKFIGGHSDLVAGVVTGPQALINPIKGFRTILGTVATPFTGWMLLRSLETLSIRMRRQAKTARKIAAFLNEHPKVTAVYYPGLLKAGDPQYDIYKRQCLGPGSLVSFDVKGGEKGAFRALDRFRVCRLAVSLGGTESLVEHPMTMTHADVPNAELEAMNVSPGMIRMSVGIEHEADLIHDIKQALE